MTIGRLRAAMSRKTFDPTIASAFGAIVVIARCIVLGPGQRFETTVPPEAAICSPMGMPHRP
ncbi:MAG TPA: hypothetical protein VET87_02625 [Rubrivivax sp.]|nr:hypothetical protein [Rubrivivax sp.]